jgi:hypothetical protein
LGQEASYEGPRDAAAVEYIAAVECTAVENTVVVVVVAGEDERSLDL